MSEEQDIGDNVRLVEDNGKVAIEEADMNKVPFLQLRTWKNIQQNDGVHTRLMRLIKSGQEPEKKRTGSEHTMLKHLHTLYLCDNLKVHTSGVIMVRTQSGFYNGFSNL